MATADRSAEVTWNGTLQEGSGTLQTGSGAVKDLGVTWASRVEKSDGRTSPEELIAAAHASCFAMAFSGTLGRGGTPPEQLRVSATVSLNPKEGGGFQVTNSKLVVRGRVPGLDQAAFAEAARRAEQGCPVSNALRNSLQIDVEATLEG
ncbi:MAG: OsmC family peroxiredoxin [Dehalococcoidia bacterium]|nr:OsmC family peroxiredoxin [Dehalococcoidia bacterium]